MATDLLSEIQNILRTTLFGAYSPWLFPVAVFIFTWLKFSRPYLGYFFCALAVLLLVDLVINPQIFKDTFLDEQLFHGSWFNPNVSSVALSLFSFLIPKALTFEVTKDKSVIVSSHYFDFVILFAVFLSSSIIGLFVISISIFTRNRDWFLSNRRYSIGIAVAGFVFLLLNLGHLSKSISIRMSIWRSAFRILEQNFLYGIGPGNFKQFFLEYREEKLTLIKGKDLIQIDPHNLILNSLLSFGVFSTTVILLILIFLLIRLRRNQSAKEFLLIFTFLTQAMFNVNSVIINSFFIFVFVILRKNNKPISHDFK